MSVYLFSFYNTLTRPFHCVQKINGHPDFQIATKISSMGHIANSSRGPFDTKNNTEACNAKFDLVEQPLHGRLIARRNIARGEEILWDYRCAYDKSIMCIKMNIYTYIVFYEYMVFSVIHNTYISYYIVLYVCFLCCRPGYWNTMHQYAHWIDGSDYKACPKQYCHPTK
jgi:hypothetical protein